MIKDKKSVDGYQIPKQIIEDKGLKNKIESYDNYTDLLADLYDEKIEYIFLPSGYQTMFTSIEAYKNIAEDTKVLYTQKKFAKEAVNNKWYSASKNLKTSAEIGKNYIAKTTDFEEEHTGLSDVKIEIEIFAKCVKQHKRMDRNINRMCWKIPTEYHKEFLKAAFA